MKSAKRVKGRPIIGESRTEEIEETVGSTGGSALTVDLEEDFSEKYGHRERSLSKTQVVVALDILKSPSFNNTFQTIAKKNCLSYCLFNYYIKASQT
jgi:hypothetical protein